MNREEAIKIFQDKLHTMEHGAICCNFGIDKDAFTLAIQALEQEPFDDTILSLTKRVETQVREDMDNFIFTTIKPWCEAMEQREISKRDLEQALTQYFSKEPCDKCVYSTSEGCQYDDITETIPPFEDCISRQAAIDACLNGWNKDYKEIVEEIRTLSPVTPQTKQEPCDGAISKKAVLDLLENTNNGWIINKVLQLPSVNPQKPICPSAGVDCEDCPAYEKKPNKWIPIKTRPLTNKEKEEYADLGYSEDSIDSMYDCPLPNDGEEVLITTRYDEVTTDTFYRDEGCYFETYCDKDDVKAWMPLPKPYKAEGSEE